MRISEADVPTTSAISYLRQLCRHWAHKFRVEFDDQRGVIHLPAGVCTLESFPEHLQVRLEMPDETDSDQLEKVVAEHLQRFGFREQLVFPWRRS